MKRLIKKLLATTGYQIERLPKDYIWGVDAFSDQAKLVGTSGPNVILDLGANTGQTLLKYREYFPSANYYCFEPTPNAFLQLQAKFHNDPLVHLFRLAVADRKGELEFHLNQENTTNSILSNHENSFEFVDSNLTTLIEKVVVESDTLDSICSKERLTSIDILKMDIQGAEGLAIKGAEGLLQRCEIRFVYTEVLFAPLYLGQSTFFELVIAMERVGYRLYGLYSLKTMNKGLAWADALFISPMEDRRLSEK